MLATFDWLTTATDADIGYPADGNRLVQAWAWFALDIPTSFGQPSWYHLFDPGSRTIMPLGEAYGAYTAPLMAPVTGRIDLQPRAIRLTGTEVEDGGRLRAVVTAEVHNGGGSRAEDVVVRFERNGAAAGEVTIPAIAAGALGQGSVVWSGLAPGTYDVRVEVEPDGQISECDPFDNSLATRLSIGPTSSSPLRKLSNKSRAVVGEPVRFTIVVTNPPEEAEGETWYQLTVTDEIHPALRIDDVAVVPAADTVAVDGKTVEVTVESLAPEASFAITVDCTLVGPVVPGQVIGNTATLAYEDGGGNPQPAEEAEEPPEILVVSRAFCPVVLR
jgi:fimbrial isopeptide formation D2 family protein